MKSNKKKIKIGDIVVVNKDITRLEEYYERDRRVGFVPIIDDYLNYYSSHTPEEYNKKVIEFRRHYKLYATKGETGKVINLMFTRDRRELKWQAQVLIDCKIKTFRLGSIDKM